VEGTVKDRTKELAALNAIAATVSQSLELDEILSDALDKTLEVMEIETGGIYLLDSEAGALMIAVQRGFKPDLVPKIDRLAIGEGFSGRVAESGEPLVVRDVSSDPRLTRMVVREEGLRSLATVPLSSKGNTLGTLFAVTHGLREFDEQDLLLLTSIGHQIGVAVENARLFEAEKRRAEEFRVINEVGRRITAILPVEDLLAEITRVLKETLGYYLVGIALIEDDHLVFKAGAGAVWDGDGFRPPRLQVGVEGITGWVAESGEPLLVPDVSREPRYYALPEAGKVRSELAVPLKSKEKVIGVLHAQSDSLNAFDAHDLTVLQSLAHQAAMAIENAGLFESERQRRQEATLLADVARIISGTLDVDQVLRLTAEYAVDVFEVDCCCILLYEEGDGTLKPAVHITHSDKSAADIAGMEFTPSDSLRQTVFEELRPLIIDSVPENPHLIPQDVLSCQSALVVPLEAGGRRLGVVQLGTQDPSPRQFSVRQGELAHAMANQAAMAIENARLFDAEQRRAEQFRVIGEVGRHVTSLLSVDEILEQIVRSVKTTLGYHQVGIGLVDGEEVVYSTGAGAFWEQLEFKPIEIRLSQDSITGLVVQSGEPILVRDIRTEPRYHPVPGDTKTKSELLVPLKAKESVIGVLAVSSEWLDGFDETDLTVLQSLANQAALAIENARLFEAEQLRAEQFRVISAVGRHITSILDIDDLLAQMTWLIKKAFNYHGVGIGLIEGDTLVFRAGAGSFWEDPEFETLSLKVGQDGITGWVAESGEPLLVADVQQEPRYYHPPLPQAGKTRSELAVPIKIKEQVIGVLDVEAEHLSAFDEDDLVVLQSLANQAAVAIDNARLFDAEQRRSEQFRVMTEVGRRITSILDIDEVLVQVVRLIQKAFGYDHVHIGIVEGDYVVYKHGAGELWEDPDFVFRPDRLKVGEEGFTGWVAGSGQPLLVPDVSQDPRYVWMEGSNTRSELTVPIKFKDNVVGVLNVQSQTLNAFDKGDLDVLQSLANQTAVAIDNARLFEAEQRRAEQFRVISETGRRILSVLDVDELLVEMAGMIHKAFDYYHVGIGLIEEDEVVSLAEVGPSASADQSGRLKVGTERVWGWVAGTGEPLLLPDVSQDPRFLHVADTSAVRSQICVPLKTKGAVIGVLSAESDQLNAFDESDLVVLQSLAHQAAFAIENARFFQDITRQVRDLRALADASRIISSVLDQDQLLEALYEQITLIAPTDFYVIALYDEETNVVSIEINVDLGVRYPKERYVLDRGLLKHVIHNRRPLRYDSLSEVRHTLGIEPMPVGSPKLNHGWLGVPMLYGEKVVGAIVVGSYERGAFDERHQQTLTSIANQAAVALENARLYKQAQQLAVLEERQRLARDLHDAVTQTLFSASLIAEALPAVWAADKDEGEQLLKELRQLSRGALAEMRTLLLELRPAALVEARLGDLLRQLSEAITGRTGLPITVKVESQRMLPSEVHVAMYRIAQEALNNVVKHAHAQQVEVTLRRTPTAPEAGRDGMQLEVKDDGRGFDPDDVPPDHMGLRIIRERAQAVGGAAEIDSQPGHGTRVTVVWEGRASG
jgi:GAF domain-containing protein